MADDIPIKISDNISASIERKIKAIGAAARSAGGDVDFLKREIAGLSSSVRIIQNTASAANTLRTSARQSSAQLAAMSAQAGYLGARLQTVNQQARQAAGGFATLGRAGQGFFRVVSGGNGQLRQAAALLASVAGINAFINAADGAANMRNQIRLVTDSEEQLVATQQKLFDISLKTNTNIDTTSRLYTRLVQALGSNTNATRDALMMTELLNKAVVATGRTQSEASSAILQFTQAMAKGKLDGDEFRSLLENLPILGKQLEKQLHVTRGELLALAPAGKITMDVITKAVLGMKVEVYKAFSEVEKTIGMALENLNTRFVMFMNENGAAAQFLIGVIDLLADNLHIVIPLVIAFGIAWGTVLIAGVINDLRLLVIGVIAFAAQIPGIIAGIIGWATAQGSLAAAMAATWGPVIGFTALVLAMTYAFAAFLSLVTGEDIVGKVNKLFSDLGSLVSGALNSIIGVSQAAAAEFGGMGTTATVELDKAASAAMGLTTELTATGDQAGKTGSAISTMADKSVAGITRVINSIDTLIWKMNKGAENATRLFNALQKVGGSQGSFQTAGITNTGANSSITNVPKPNLTGSFAKGGSFMVGGKGGVDKNRIGMNVSRGERVTVETKKQQRRARQGSSTVNHDNRVINFNVFAADAESFRRSRKQVAGDFAAIAGSA